MILVCTGTQKFQFDRLLKAVDALCESGAFKDETVFAQTGASGYRPRHCRFKSFLEPAEMDSLMSGADLVVTHGGSGSIMSALRLKKKVVAVPRLGSYKEHVDDHQKQLVRMLAKRGFIIACEDLSDPLLLLAAIEEAKSRSLKTYPFDRGELAEDLMTYLSQIS